MTRRRVDECQAAVALGAFAIDTESFDRLTEHRLDRIAIEAMHPHLREFMPVFGVRFGAAWQVRARSDRRFDVVPCG
jgi:hypothetical protein